MVGKVRPGARIVGLLGLPRYDPAFDVDFPRAGARAIHAMRGPHDLVCGPAFPVGILPHALLVGGDAVALRHFVPIDQKVPEAYAELDHLVLFRSERDARWRWRFLHRPTKSWPAAAAEHPCEDQGAEENIAN